ncbi:glycosyltransferase family 4 protein [Hydrogenophaga sp. XSHU_21]
MRGDPIVLPIEEDNSAALLPVLKLLAAFTRSRSICVVRPDLSRHTVTRWQIASDAIRFAGASVACRWAAHRARRELNALVVAERVIPQALSEHGEVLYLKTNLWFGIKAGGSVGHIAGVVNGLQRSGHPVTFASAEPAVMIDDGVQMLDVRPPRAFGLPYELNNYRFQSSFDEALARTPVLGRARLIYQRLSAANYLGAVLSRRHRLPLVVEYNGSEVWVAKNWGRGMKFHALAEMAEAAMLRHAHLVVTVSDVLKEELIGRGVEPGRIVSYPNCIDPKVFDPTRFDSAALAGLRQRLGISTDALLVTFVGTFGQWHGAEKLAAAVAQLWNRQRDWLVSSKLHFLFVGDGLTRPRVVQIIAEAGAEAVCTFAGLVPQPEAPLHLAASDILVSPHVPNADGSRFFGSPTKLFEYMAMGKAILASDLEQIGEVLSPGLRLDEPLPDGSTIKPRALLVTPGEVEELVLGLQRMAGDESLRIALGRNAREAALEYFTWDVHVDKILDGVGRQQPMNVEA